MYSGVSLPVWVVWTHRPRGEPRSRGSLGCRPRAPGASTGEQGTCWLSADTQDREVALSQALGRVCFPKFKSRVGSRLPSSLVPLQSFLQRAVRATPPALESVGWRRPAAQPAGHTWASPRGGAAGPVPAYPPRGTGKLTSQAEGRLPRGRGSGNGTGGGGWYSPSHAGHGMAGPTCTDQLRPCCWLRKGLRPEAPWQLACFMSQAAQQPQRGLTVLTT